MLSADDLDPITFCEECAPAASDLVPLPNSPRVGVNCYDNVYSYGSWPWGDPEWQPTARAGDGVARPLYEYRPRGGEITPRDPAPESTWRPQTGLIRRVLYRPGLERGGY